MFALSILLLGFSATAMANGIEIPNEGVGPRSLEFRIEVAGKEHSLHEPIVLKYTLSNPTHVAVKCRANLPFMFDTVKVEIGHAGNKTPFFTGPIVDGSSGEATIAPGHSIADSVVMFSNNKAGALAFPGLGRYSIHARIYLGDYPDPVVIAAPPVDIEIVEPRETEEKVIEYLGSKEQLITLLGRGAAEYCNDKPAARCLEELRLLMKQFPDASYTPHIAFDLASAIEWGGLAVAPQYDLAVDVLNAFLEKWPNHPLAAEVTTALVYTLDKAGRKKEAVDWINRFERDYPARAGAAREMRYRIQGVKMNTPPD